VLPDIQARLRLVLDGHRGRWVCGFCLATAAQIPWSDPLSPVDAFVRAEAQRGVGGEYEVRRAPCGICGLEKRVIRTRPAMLR
jgi:hypothetical protein